jgi:hypothetical protein
MGAALESTGATTAQLREIFLEVQHAITSQVSEGLAEMSKELSEYFGISTLNPLYLRKDLSLSIKRHLDQDYIPLPKDSDHPNHTLERNTARDIMLNTIIKHNRRPYTVQFAPVDAKDTRTRDRGDHAHITPRDLAIPTRLDTINVQRDVVVITDTDYYINPLKYAGAHILVYTQCFDGLTGQDGEVAWEFTDRSTVRYSVQGGSTYEHQVWDYDRDWVTAEGTWLTHTAGRLVHYRIDKYHLEHGMIVHLRPVFSTNDWTSWQDWPLLRTRLPWFGAVKAEPLSRVVVAESASYLCVTRTPVGKRARTYIRLKGYVGGESVDAAALSVVASRAGTTATKIELHTIEQILRNQPHPPENISSASSYVLGILREGLVPTTNRMSSESNAELLYEIYHPEKACDTEMKSPHSVLADPLIEATPVHTPVRTVINEEVAIATRIEQISVDKPVTSQMKQRINEFVDTLLAKHEPAFSADFDKVLERQDTQTKRIIFERAQQLCAAESPLVTKIAAFMKDEPMSEAKEPRVISPTSPLWKCQAAALLYSELEQWAKRQPWYMFNEPKEIERKMCEMHTRVRVRWLLLTDFSRLDGRYFQAGRLLEKTFLKKFFDVSVHAQIDEIYEHILHSKGKGQFEGNDFHSLFARLSGEMFTSLMNTLWNAYIMYVAFRQGLSMKPRDAVNALGGYGGDDGFTPNIEEKHLDAVAKEYYQELTYKRATPELGYFDFLGRYFSWSTFSGEPNSCIDVKRQMRKMHVAKRTNAFKTELLHMDAKVASLLHTDEHAPILGPWCKKYATFRKQVRNLQPESFVRYAAKTETKFTQFRADWMAGICEPMDVDTIEATIAGITSITQLLRIPITNPLPAEEPKYDHVIRGEGRIKGKKTFEPTPKKVKRSRAKRSLDCSV